MGSKHTNEHNIQPINNQNPWRLWRPPFLTAADYPWLLRLLDEAVRLVGQKRADFERRFNEPMPFVAPKIKLDAAKQKLLSLLVERPITKPAPVDLRRLLFANAGHLINTRSLHDSLSVGSMAFRLKAAEQLEIKNPENSSIDFAHAMQNIYADIPAERIIESLPREISPASLALSTNSFLVSRYLRRAHHVVIDLNGEARRVVRQAKLRGLVCQVERTAFGTRLTVSGPLSVIRHTTYYGRFLAELIPFLSWCPKYRLIAVCGEPQRNFRMMIMSGDPLPAAPSLPSFDSKVERMFASDFKRVTNEWDLIREPEPIAVSENFNGTTSRLIFPDFAALQRTNPNNRWLIEIVGYWSPAYLAAKLDDFKLLGSTKVLLCIDEKLIGDSVPLLATVAMIRYKNRVNAIEVLQRLSQ